MKMAKTIYVVQDEVGIVYETTTDRDEARSEKAYLGGKKAGIVIIAYKPSKEIR